MVAMVGQVVLEALEAAWQRAAPMGTEETPEPAAMAAREELVAQATMEAMAPHSIPMAKTAARAEQVARLGMVATAALVVSEPA